MRLLALTLALSVVSITSYAQDIPRVLSSDEQSPGQICAPADAVKAALTQQHYRPVAIMRTDGGTAVTLMATEDGHWVLSELVPQGNTLLSCYRSHGDAFTIELPTPPAPGRGA